MAAIAPNHQADTTPPYPPHAPRDRWLLGQAIHSMPTSVDAVTATCALRVHRVLATINVLETRRLVRRVSGTQVVRVPSGPRPPRWGTFAPFPENRTKCVHGGNTPVTLRVYPLLCGYG